MNVKRIKESLEAMGRDADWLADQVGVARSTMKQNYLRGLAPSKAVAISIARELKCEISDVLTNEEREMLGFDSEAS